MAKVISQETTYLVVNIGYIHDELNIEMKVVCKNTTDDVNRHIIPGVAEMSVVVDCRAASVPFYVLDFKVSILKRSAPWRDRKTAYTPLNGYEFLLLSGEGVVQSQRW